MIVVRSANCATVDTVVTKLARDTLQSDSLVGNEVVYHGSWFYRSRCQADIL